MKIQKTSIPKRPAAEVVDSQLAGFSPEEDYTPADTEHVQPDQRLSSTNYRSLSEAIEKNYPHCRLHVWYYDTLKARHTSAPEMSAPAGLTIERWNRLPS